MLRGINRLIKDEHRLLYFAGTPNLKRLHSKKTAVANVIDKDKYCDSLRSCQSHHVNHLNLGASLGVTSASLFVSGKSGCGAASEVSYKTSF